MAYLRISEARAVGSAVRLPLRKSAGQILVEDARRFSTDNQYDIFLSHAFDDAELILGVKSLIEERGLSVYVDWIEDSGLDRRRVTAWTAGLLRERMRTCLSLVYAHSTNSPSSVWMPWELGYFDGLKPYKVWILPLVAMSDDEFKNQEYLGLYPTIESVTNFSGQQELGFENVGRDRRRMLLSEAIRYGVYLS